MNDIDGREGTSRQVAGGHYLTMPIQPAEYCERNQLTGLESAVVKYVSRHRFKNGIEDIDKAIHCLELIKEFQYDNSNL